MWNSISKNWKTTLSGIVAALFGFVLFSPEHFQQWPWLISLAKYACAGGLAALGLMGKDYNNHSTIPEVKEATYESAEKIQK